METQVTINARFSKKVYGEYSHKLYLDVKSDNYIDGSDDHDIFRCDTPFENFSFVKVPYYDKVLAITSRLNVRMTVWDSISEVEEAFDNYDIVSHRFYYDGASVYVLACSGESIDDFFEPVALVSVDPFECPDLNHDEEYSCNGAFVAHFQKPKKGSKFHYFSYDSSGDIATWEENDGTKYEFNNLTENLALVKPSNYPYVLIITPTLKVRYTPWLDLEEAHETIANYDLYYYRYNVNGETYGVVACDDDYIEDFEFDIIDVEEIEREDYIEFKNSNNNDVVVYVTNATARSIAYQLSKKGSTRYDRDELEELFLIQSEEFLDVFNLHKDSIKRNVYHKKRRCQLLYSDYDVGKKHYKNSGVFEADTFEFTLSFLKKLDFRPCSRCS